MSKLTEVPVQAESMVVIVIVGPSPSPLPPPAAPPCEGIDVAEQAPAGLPLPGLDESCA
jgi:hypothetical protein